MGLLQRLFAKKPHDDPAGTATCAACAGGFTWDEAYWCRDTPGRQRHFPCEIPRVYCPHCGVLVVQWHVEQPHNPDEEVRGLDSWAWFGDHGTVNAGLPSTPDWLLRWGKPIPEAHVPHYPDHHLDIDTMKKGAALSDAPPGSSVAEAIELVCRKAGESPDTLSLDDALLDAAHLGMEEAVGILLDEGANANGKTAQGRTPLLLAASAGHAATVARLLSAGADANDQDVFAAHTPLILAALEGHTEVVEILLQGGADVSLRNQFGHTAMEHASKRSDEELQRLLREAIAKTTAHENPTEE
jgi:uncharacterized protein